MNPKTIEYIQRTMQNDILVFFGKGSFYSYYKAARIIIGSSCSTDEKNAIIECLTKITKNGLFNEPQYANVKEIKMLDSIGISRVGIKKEEANSLGIDEIQGLYDMITSFYSLGVSKRRKREFPKPRKDSYGRWKSNISLHYVYSTTTKMYSVADKDKEKYERKVLSKLVEVYTTNLS